MARDSGPDDGEPVDGTRNGDGDSGGTDWVMPESVGGNFDPSAAESDSGGESASGQPKRRGRKPGSKNKKNSLHLVNLKFALIFFHAGIALRLKDETFNLSDDEATALADAMKAVGACYIKDVTDPKTIAWGNLFLVASGIYGAKFLGARMKKAMAPKETPENVAPFYQAA